MVNKLRNTLKKTFNYILQVFDDVSAFCERNQIF